MITNITEEMIRLLRTTDSRAIVNEIEGLVESRISDMMPRIFETFGCVRDAWWSWEEGNYEGGNFDARYNLRQDKICYYIADMSRLAIIIDKDGNELDLREGAPLRWLWEDYDTELRNGYKPFKEKKLAEEREKVLRLQDFKMIKNELKQKACDKLTDEEAWACGLLHKLPKSLRQYKDILELVEK